ncbi:hypothetical protein SAY87_008658 [Trapa incisa]|uniref:BURP domain-containing protein n=1 Tax=Trapa incisa TaxID=236973 RepID=A0AAN7JVM2_9MYRT|nr:hypothetical protein SAY87_008658 [Trapa incisa]
MALQLPRPSWSIILFFQLAMLLFFAQGRKLPTQNSEAGVNHKEAFDITNQPGDVERRICHDRHHHRNASMDPSLNVFFTVEDLKIGKTLPFYFPPKPDPSKTPRLLPREEAESIPFSSSQLHLLLDYFSFSHNSPQAIAMAYTLEQCELVSIEGEVKFCTTSLEDMLDKAHQIFGPGSASNALTTTYTSMSSTTSDVKNYTILKSPKEVEAKRMIGCHPMPYPYAVFYCHSQQQSLNRLYQISLGGPDQERVEATAVCHMDTSKWDTNHVSFRVLGIKPRSSPVCHIFPIGNIIWVT